MIIGVVTESWPGERRVALVPMGVSPLIKAGHQVLVESNAGFPAGFTNQAYTDKGATVAPARAEVMARADLLLRVRIGPSGLPSTDADLSSFRSGQIVIAFLDPLGDHVLVRQLAERQVSAFSMELMPRITRAQSMDALSSMATIAGYKAVLLAAVTVPRMFPMLMTAAGNVSAARAFVIGAGVAGLQAIATTRRLGAIVSAFDVRPAAAEQVKSLGATFVASEVVTAGAEQAGGYAREQAQDERARTLSAIGAHIVGQDLVITTAQVPGRPAPRLITAEMVRGMKPGSVIVDVAGETGGNCELSVPGETVVQHGVSIMAPLDLASAAPVHASQMFSRNVLTLLQHLVKEGRLVVDLADEITGAMVVTHGGAVRTPGVAAPVPAGARG